MYPLEALSDEAQSKIRRPARPKPTQPAPADSASVQKEPNDKKRLFLGLGPGQRARVEAKAEAVRLWRHYKQRVSREISIGDARKAFCTLWKAGQAGAEERARKALPSFGITALYNWDRALARGGLTTLVDQRGQAQAGRGILDTDTRMRDVVLGMLAAHPHAGATHLAQRAGGAISLLSAAPPGRSHHPALDETMEGGEQGIVGIPMRSGRCERSLRCLHRTGRRRCGFTECALGDRRHQGRCAAVRRAEVHHTRHHRRLEPPHAAACRTHITLDRRLHRTAPRDPRVGSAQRRAMRQRQGVHLPPHTHRSHGPRD